MTRDDARLQALAAAHARRKDPGGAAAAPQRRGGHEAVVRLTLEDAQRGTTVLLDVAHEEEGSRTRAVTLPAGLADGQCLHLRGQPGTAEDDIYLHVELLPHPVFRVDGHDLWIDLPLAPWEAALGAAVQVPTLEGPVALAVPPGTGSGRRLRVRGGGLAHGRGRHGDLWAVARVDVPPALTGEEKALFAELARVSAFQPRAAVAEEPSHETHSA